MTLASSTNSPNPVRTKTVGILGGMGPYSTLAFLQLLMKSTPARKDAEHLRIITDVHPHIPSRSRHCLYGEPSPTPEMIASCLKLQSYPVDFIVIPCNSAAYFIEEVQSHLKIPVLNIVDITVKALRNTFPNARQIAVAAGPLNKRWGLYEKFLKAQGCNYIECPDAIQSKIEALIEYIKINNDDEKAANDLTNIIHSLEQECSAEAVLLGCTEFGCVQRLQTNIAVVDSTKSLARATVIAAGYAL